MKQLFCLLFLCLLVSCSSDSDSAGGETGVNGSITRFSISGNYMYAIDVNYLRIYDISNGDDPRPVQSIKVGYGLETIHIYGQHIYLGAVDGVYIVDVQDPTHPRQLDKIEHHITCDPVVVQGSYAYSTQRADAIGCGNFWSSSVLAVYNVSDPNHSELIDAINMSQPYGLYAEGSWLYVCDPGQSGIVVFDISNPAQPLQKNVITVPEPRDIIAHGSYMIVTTKTRFEIYDRTDPLNLRFVSALKLD